MWILYEKRINKYLKDKNLNINCHYTRPQVKYLLLSFEYKIISLDIYST